MRSLPSLTAAGLAGLLTFAAPRPAPDARPPAPRATPSIQSLASPRAAPPIGAGVDASLQLGCAPLQPREPAPVMWSHGWKRIAARDRRPGVCGKPATWGA